MFYLLECQEISIEKRLYIGKLIILSPKKCVEKKGRMGRLLVSQFHCEIRVAADCIHHWIYLKANVQRLVTVNR